MSTAAYDTISRLPVRVQELELLASKARQLRDKEERVYNALCRSCSVLIASHIEGAIKDISDSVRMDLNFFLRDFSKLPESLKRNFCQNIAFYEGVPQGEIDKRILQLISFFNRNSVPIELDAFPYIANPNKNPKPSSIDKPFERFGVNGALHAIGSDFYLQVFSPNPAKIYVLRRNFKKFRSHLFHFPYKTPSGEFFAKPAKGKAKEQQKNLWSTFLEEIVTRRHNIVHGDTVENPTTVDELENDILKAETLLHGLTYYFCGAVGSLVGNGTK